MFKAVIFDFDGVIVDSEPLHYRAFLDVARSFGKTFDYDEYLRTFIGYDDRDAFRVMLTGQAEPGDAALEQRIVQLGRDKAVAFERIVNEGIEPTPGVMRFIDEAAAAGPIAICSGATRFDIELIVNRLGLSERFETIVSADDVERSKPHPASYALAVERLAQQHAALELKPGECLAIEDTAAGLRSARDAGLYTVGLASTGPRELLRDAHRVIDSFDDLSIKAARRWMG